MVAKKLEAGFIYCQRLVRHVLRPLDDAGGPRHTAYIQGSFVNSAANEILTEIF